MNIYRSYFEKNNTIVKNSSLNSAKNQVTEIAYGGDQNILTKFIFKINLINLKNKIDSRELSIDKINSHILYLKNTINLSTTKNTDLIQERTSSFDLVLFKINEDWDEGNGYDIMLDSAITTRNKNTNGSNWFNKETNLQWGTSGINDNNNIEIIDTVHFDNGDEDFIVDITSYINELLYTSGTVDYGLGISFPLAYETLTTEYIQSVNFHTKYTNTFFEPYLETKFDNIIFDDRKCFHLNTDNRLYFFAKRDMTFFNVNITSVNIFNNNNEIVKTYQSNEIIKHSRGIYYIDLNFSSDQYIDSVLFRDQWNYEINGTEKTIINSFYIMSELNMEELENNLTSLKIFGIYNNQIFKRGEKINIDLDFISLFKNAINYCDYEFSYNLYVKYGRNNIYVIKDGLVNRAPNKYFISFDSEILLPNTYYLDITLKYKDLFYNNANLNFRISE
jgi:hypothetical protein